MSVKVTAITSGQQSRASLGNGKYYRYNGDQPDRQRGERKPLPQNRAATAAKRKRVAEYTRLRLEGKSKDEAAQAIGISASTMGYYERAFRDERPEVARDA